MGVGVGVGVGGGGGGNGRTRVRASAREGDAGRRVRHEPVAAAAAVGSGGRGVAEGGVCSGRERSEGSRCGAHRETPFASGESCWCPRASAASSGRSGKMMRRDAV